MHPLSNQACAAPSRCTNGHSNLVQELDKPKTATAKGHSFCTTQPEHLSLHSNKCVNNHPKTCNCEISTVCCTVCTVRTKICMQLESPQLCRELN